MGHPNLPPLSWCRRGHPVWNWVKGERNPRDHSWKI